MKLSSIAAFTFCIFSFSLSPAFASNSTELSDVQPLLNQQPDLWRFYKTALDIYPHGSGGRISTDGSPLKGYRTAPYEFPARVKGWGGFYNLRLTLMVDTYYFDADGKATTDLKKAVKMKEVLAGIAAGPLVRPRP